MKKINVYELKKILEQNISNVNFTVIDPNTMTEAEIKNTLNDLKERSEKFNNNIEIIFKQIHNDNVGAQIERYYEDAENYFGDCQYILNKLKKRIKKYFDER